MAGFSLTPEADQDLNAIYLYSFDSFGEKQADLYTNRLISAFELLVTTPYAGRDASHIRSGTRCLAQESHILYYEVAGLEIVILRILHHAQDPLRHFK